MRDLSIEEIERLTEAFMAKALLLGNDSPSRLHDLISQVIVDTWLVCGDGPLTVADFEG